MLGPDGKHGTTEIIFAWFPVRTKNKKFVWLTNVERVWNSYKDYSILMADDPGDYVGGWEYSCI